MYLFLPLLAAVAFALGSMVFKRAFLEGAGMVHATVVNHVLLGFFFLPLLAWETKPIPWAEWHMPVLTAFVFLLGHLLNILSLRVGDVTVATPLLGAKVVFVGAIGWGVFGTQLTPWQWVSTGLATVGVVLMGLTDLRPGRRMGLTTVSALGCAAAFALTDTMIQAWGGVFGVPSFLALQCLALSLMSVVTLPAFGPGALRAPAGAWKWILLGAALSAVQAAVMTVTIAVWRDAAGVNVVYATRGLWSIVLVWCVGHHLKNRERETAGGRRMGLRLAGAALILVAVFLTVGQTAQPGAIRTGPGSAAGF
jgi:drug/metabolite transporter (DMT)-like permease